MPLSAEDRLVLIRIKIERARKHLQGLAEDLLAVEKHTIVEKESGSFKTVPMLPWGVIAATGDIVHNLRSALDHLAWQLVCVGTPGMEPTRQVGFPIAIDADTYNTEKTAKVNGMSEDAKEKIDRLQPYKGGDDNLWRIHELDNIDKHRTLLTVAYDVTLAADWIGAFRGYRIVTEAPNFGGDFDRQVGQNLLSSLRDLVNHVDQLVRGFKALLE